MGKNILKGFSLILGAVFLFGCASTKDVEVRRYVEVKERLDQNMEGGNSGYLSGTPQPEDRSGFRTTRKVYVVEVSQGEMEPQSAVDVEESYDDQESFSSESYESEADNVIEVSKGLTSKYRLPDVSSEDVDETGYADSNTQQTFVEYTVAKDDTLQKISKKFYGSFSKWPRIYENNKDVIQNPDRIKEGIVLQIPVDE